MAAVDGLVSGIDVTSIVSQLVKVDAATQDRLKTNVSTAQNEIKGYQAVNTKMAALKTAVEGLTKAGGWSPVTAKSSSDAVAVAATGTADQGSISFRVNSLASPKSILSNVSAGASDVVDPNSLGLPVDVYRNGSKVGSISPTSGTLSEIAASINTADSMGVKAVAIRISADQYRLQITSTNSGTAGDFQLKKADGTDAEAGKFDAISSATDAELLLGSGGVSVKSSTNTFPDLIPGVTVTASKADPAATVTVSSARDSGKLGDAMKAVVDAANAALTEIGNQTKAGVVGSDGKLSGSGALMGDSTLRGLQTQILSAVSGAFGGGTSGATVGLQTNRSGTLDFDRTKFVAAFEADPKGIQALLNPTTTPRPAGADLSTPDTRSGLLERLGSVATAATKSGIGSLATAIDGRNSTVKDLTDRISDWDDRLAAKKTAYQSYYTRLETALGSLKSQGSWLSSQLSAL
ncbi:flagellar filament capping protein FliD [Kineococcus gynurae]|uniref:Flagellar hook-associated protein 2 n=1 Tax=Kineococcus gynurae TaxID=452979 RepID=A0ABV5LR93_9ACTN